MLDLKFIRENLDLVKEGVKNKREKVDLDRLISLDSKRREILQEVEQLKNQRNTNSQLIAQLKKEGKSADAEITEMQKVGDKIKEMDAELRALENEIKEIQSWVPNPPHSSVPIGQSEEDNVEIKKWGTPPELNFTPKPHWEIAENLGIIDFARGSKISGSFFVSYQGW